MLDDTDTIGGSVRGLEDIRFFREVVDDSCLTRSLRANDQDLEFG